MAASNNCIALPDDPRPELKYGDHDQRAAELVIAIQAVNMISELRAELEHSTNAEHLLWRFTTLYHGRLSRLLDSRRRKSGIGKRSVPACIEFVDLQSGSETAMLRYVAVNTSKDSVTGDVHEIINYLRAVVQDLVPVL